MQLSTWIMLSVCLVWFFLFALFTTRDLRTEDKKSKIISEGGEVDPFLFSGEKARTEAAEIYEKDPVARKYFDEIGITLYLKR